MAISSNGVAGLRTGVCTSTTRPSSPYEGQMIYETDTDLTYIYGGSAWQQIAGGTAVGNSGLVYVAGGTFSGVTSASPLDINSVFSSTYRNYVLLLRVEQTVTNGAFLLRMRTVSTLETGAIYNHGFGGTYITAGPTYVWNAYSFSSPVTPDTYFYSGLSPASGYGSSGKIEIMSPQEARATRYLAQSWTPNAGSQSNVNLSGSGSVENTTQYTGLRLYPNNGTSSGEYQVYGYRIA